MTGLSARRLATALAVSSASALALVLPGVASATTTPTAIQGQGSTLQEVAQQNIFKPKFNEKESTGEKNEVSHYTGTGSGAGLEAWGNGGHAAEYNTYQYVGTDQPPNPTQKAAIESKAGGAVVLSIPTLQAAVALIVHAPAGCTGVKSSAKKETHRLALNDKTVEEIFAHKITKWSQVKEEGNGFTPAGCAGESEITRVVRSDGSGTTAITKKWLYQVAPKEEYEVEGEKQTWNDMAEKNKNLGWPEEGVKLVRGHGTPGVVAAVEATPGSIGYANLANAYEAKFGKEGAALSWADVENKSGKKPSYANPEKPGPKKKIGGKKVITEGTSNCTNTVYVNGVGAKFPPASTEEAWNEVSSTPTEPNYSICGFTYDLSLNGFTDIEPKLQPSTNEIEVVKKYFTFMIEQGPHLLVNGTDYLALPENAEEAKSVYKIAKKGTEKIK